jgi:hypothetical protein
VTAYGLHAALTTPFDERGDPDLEAVRAHIEQEAVNAAHSAVADIAAVKRALSERLAERYGPAMRASL